MQIHDTYPYSAPILPFTYCIKHKSIYHKVYNYHIGSCLHIEQYGNYS